MHKILYISHSSTLHGAERCLLTLLRHLDRAVFQPVVLFPFPGPLIERVEELDIKTYTYPLERWIRYKYDASVKDHDIFDRVQFVTSIIKEEQIEIVHTNSTVVYEGAVAAKHSNIPHVWHVHEVLEGHPELVPVVPLPLLFCCINYLSNAIATVADAVKTQFYPFVDQSKLVTIHNGIDRKPFEEQLPSSIRQILGLKQEDILLVTVGAVTKRKGYHILLEAASMVNKRTSRLKFLWVGEGERDILDDFARKVIVENLQDTVFHVGFRDDIPSILKTADLLVLPSINEAFPMVILEAMAAGKPVIASRCGGTDESVKDGETGYIVPINDPQALCDKILVLTDDPQQMLRMGGNAYKEFMQNFDADANAAKFMQLYLKLIKDNEQINPISKQEIMVVHSLMQAYHLYAGGEGNIPINQVAPDREKLRFLKLRELIRRFLK